MFVYIDNNVNEILTEIIPFRIIEVLQSRINYSSCGDVLQLNISNGYKIDRLQRLTQNCTVILGSNPTHHLYL